MALCSPLVSPATLAHLLFGRNWTRGDCRETPSSTYPVSKARVVSSSYKLGPVYPHPFSLPALFIWALPRYPSIYY